MSHRKKLEVIAAAATEPEANKQGSSVIGIRLHYRDLKSLFLTKCKNLWLSANRRFRMRSGMVQGIAVLRCPVDFHVLSWHCFREARR